MTLSFPRDWTIQGRGGAGRRNWDLYCVPLSACKSDLDAIQWDVPLLLWAGHTNKLMKSNKRVRAYLSPHQIYQEGVCAGLMKLSWKDKVEIKCTVEEGSEAQTLPRAWGQWCSKINPPSQLTPHMKIPHKVMGSELRCGQSAQSASIHTEIECRINTGPQALAHRLTSD